MATINITVEDHSIRVDNLIELAQGSNNFDTCAFTFDSSWDGFTLYASMYQNPKNVFKLPLDESNTCKIPVNVLQKSGWLYIGARGEKDDETIGTSIVVKLPVRNGAVNGNETGQEMLDQSQYEYLLGKVNELNEKCESLTKELENDFSQLSEENAELKSDLAYEKIKKYNAVALGCNNDGSNDCTEIIQNILNENGNCIIYFPIGTYNFCRPLYVRKDQSCQIVGETFPNDIFYINASGIPVAKNGTVLWFNSNTTNITFINVQEGCVSFRLKEICLYSTNGVFECDSDVNDRPYEPYNPYRYISSVSGQNGLSVIDCTKVEVDRCAIIGFTSYGLALYTTNIVRDTYIRYCGIAIELKNHDVSLYNAYITQCKGGVIASGGSTIFAYNIWIDKCVEYGIYKFGKLNGIITGLIDHCGYSGIRLDESDGLRLDLRIGRCGMYYADNVEDIKDNSSELGKSAFIKIGTCRHGEFTLSLYARSIGDDEINEYMLPKIVLAGTTWENVCVMGLNAEENYYIFSDTFSTGTNITCYTSKGLVSKVI